MKKVSVITVNFNQPEVTEDLLRSIYDTCAYPELEIIVVDNGSKMDFTPVWKLVYPSVNFIRSEVNLGFAGGNNIGIESATGDYFFLVNNDTLFTRGLVETLVKVLDQNAGVGIVSPKIKYFDQPDLIQYAGFTAMNYYLARNTSIGQYQIDHGQLDNLTGPTGFAHGAAMMIKRETIEKAGLMADNYFLYYEEMDWCDRIKRAGYDVWVCMQAAIYHKESVSVGKASPLKEYFMNRNRILYIRRNANAFSRVIFYPFFILVVVPRNIVKYIKERHFDFIPLLFKAIWWNVIQKRDSQWLGYPFK